MEQYISKFAVVAEIEKELNTTKKYSTEYVNGKKYALKKILSFIDTLEVKEIGVDLGDSQGDIGVKWVQEEPVSNDLEEAAFDYAEACKYDGGEKLLCVEHFKAGAQWQKEQVITKACEWLREHRDYVATEDNGISGWIPECFIEGFKKAMEE